MPFANVNALSSSGHAFTHTAHFVHLSSFMNGFLRRLFENLNADEFSFSISFLSTLKCVSIKSLILSPTISMFADVPNLYSCP